MESPKSSAVAVEIVVRCRACDGIVPINRLAQNAACDHCGRAVELSDATWALVFKEAEDSVAGRDGDERAAIVESGQATLRCVFRKTGVHCVACREPLPFGDANAASGGMFCPGCGAHVALRRPSRQAHGLDLLVGEEPEPKSASEKSTTTLPCGSCGAPLPIDGTRRTVHCDYCKAESAIPDALWSTVRPRRDVRRWFFVFSPKSAVDASASNATWSSVADVAADASGNVYCVGLLDAGDTETAVWCVDPDMKIKWAKRSLAGLPHRSARLCVASRGRIGVWFPGGPVVAFLDASNGETLSTFPNNRAAANRRIPVERFCGLVADLDGTLVALVTGEAWGGMVPHCSFVRFTEAGELVDLWPEVASPAPPEIGDAIPNYRSVGSQPTCIAGSPNLALGWDGTLYVYGGTYGAMGWMRIARNGFVTSERVPSESRMCIAGDLQGNLHILGQGQLVVTDNLTRRLWRLDAESGPAGIAEEHCMAVHPNGEVVLVGAGGRLRRLGPQGAVLFASEASRRADQTGHSRGWGAA